MAAELTRQQALHILQLPATADGDVIKRAYRRLAREHHPDLGGDPTTFHQLRLAYERLVDGPPGPPPVVRGRPSRSGFTEPRGADLTTVDWSVPPPTAGAPLDRDGLAVALSCEHAGPVCPVTATSRGPGSKLNRVAKVLAGDLTTRLRVAPDRDDRGGAVVGVEVRGGTRGARRALDGASLDNTWLRTRGSSTTTLRCALTPSDDRRVDAVRVVDRLESLLDPLGWPLPAWTRTGDA